MRSGTERRTAASSASKGGTLSGVPPFVYPRPTPPHAVGAQLRADDTQLARAGPARDDLPKPGKCSLNAPFFIGRRLSRDAGLAVAAPSRSCAGDGAAGLIGHADRSTQVRV